MSSPALSTVARRLHLTDSYGISGLGIILVLASAVVALVAVLVPTIIGVSRHYGRISCRTFSEQTGRQTKFVIYTTFSTGDCLTPSGSGTWIPTSNLREFGGKP